MVLRPAPPPPARAVASALAIRLAIRVSSFRICASRLSISCAAALGLGKRALLLDLEVLEAQLLARLFLAAPLELVLQPDEQLPLAVDLPVQVLDALHHGLVVQGQLVQVLVARDELTERARRQEGLGRKQRSALVDVAHPATQPVATIADLDLRDRHALVRRVDFGVDVGELLVERPDESRASLPAAARSGSLHPRGCGRVPGSGAIRP